MPGAEHAHAIEVRNLTRVFHTRRGGRVLANDDLTFNVARGQVFGLLGPNGAGKTTLVTQLLGLLRPSHGRIAVDGIDVVQDPDAVKTVTGFLPQTALPMRLIEVRRALHYTGRLRGQGESDARRQADELIEELGLDRYADRYVDRLSGGMRRLVNVGMALMGRPAVLVLDEPTNELDPHNRRLVWEMIKRRSTSEGTTVVLVTHNVLEAEQAVHRVVILDQGRIVAEGTPGQLKERLGDQARMDLVVKDGAELSPSELASLRSRGAVVAGGRSGHYVVHAELAEVPPLLATVAADLGLARLDDFRVARPTLEDVYLSLAALREDDDATRAPQPAPRPEAQPDRPARPFSPAGQPRRAPVPRFGAAFSYLWLEQMLGVRSTWSWTVLFGLLMPLAMVFGATRIGVGLTDRTSLLYIVSGAAVFAVSTEGIAVLAQQVGQIRNDGMMVYYASLPIRKAAFIGALVVSRLIMIMPGLLTPLLAGRLLYHADLRVSPALLLVCPLCALALSAVGMAIGSLVDRQDLIVVLTNLLIFVVLLATPVFIPSASLPLPLRLLGYVLPPTYAAQGLRYSFAGNLGAGFLTDVVVLSGMATLGLAVTNRWIRWRV